MKWSGQGFIPARFLFWGVEKYFSGLVSKRGGTFVNIVDWAKIA